MSKCNNSENAGYGENKHCGENFYGSIWRCSNCLEAEYKKLKEIIDLMGEPVCDDLHHPKGNYHASNESCPVVDRIEDFLEAMKYLKAGKAQFAPDTTNSDVDEFIKRKGGEN